MRTGLLSLCLFSHVAWADCAYQPAYNLVGDGDVVPTTVRPFMTVSDVPDITLVNGAGDVIPMELASTVAPNEQYQTVAVHPLEPLVPDTLHWLQVRGAIDTNLFFVTGTLPDETAPPAPVIQSVRTEATRDTFRPCEIEGPSELDAHFLHLQLDDAREPLVYEVEYTNDDGAVLAGHYAFPTGNRVTVGDGGCVGNAPIYSFAWQSGTVRLRARDRSGNIGPWSEPVAFDVEPAECEMEVVVSDPSCASARLDGWLLAWLFVPWFRRRPPG